MPDLNWLWPLAGALLTGAVGGGLISLWGQRVESERRRREWKREKRYSAFLTFLNTTDELNSMTHLDPVPTDEVFREVSKRAVEQSTAIELLGPPAVAAMAEALWFAANDVGTARIGTQKSNPTNLVKKEQIRMDHRASFLVEAKYATELD